MILKYTLYNEVDNYYSDESEDFTEQIKNIKIYIVV